MWSIKKGTFWNHTKCIIFLHCKYLISVAHLPSFGKWSIGHTLSPRIFPLSSSILMIYKVEPRWVRIRSLLPSLWKGSERIIRITTVALKTNVYNMESSYIQVREGEGCCWLLNRVVVKKKSETKKSSCNQYRNRTNLNQEALFPWSLSIISRILPSFMGIDNMSRWS